MVSLKKDTIKVDIYHSFNSTCHIRKRNIRWKSNHPTKPLGVCTQFDRLICLFIAKNGEMYKDKFWKCVEFLYSLNFVSNYQKIKSHLAINELKYHI